MPRLIQDLLDNLFIKRMLAKIAVRNRFFLENWKVPHTKSTKLGHKRPSRQSLAGMFGNSTTFYTIGLPLAPA